ncbi:MAG: BamA/TamA family outer membrane protein [Calditrichaeota bacterium]|nr:BamA/TamA family outer membrane protein [Calditrichota bacterium]
MPDFRIMIFTLLFALINLLPAQKMKDYEKLFSMPEIERRAVKKYIQQNEKEIKRYQEDVHIDRGDTLDVNIFVNHGDLIVEGVVKGDVLVLFGDVKLENTSRVNGNVTSVNGRIYQDPESIVTGNQIETNIKNLFPAREFGSGYNEDIMERYLSRYTKPYGQSYSTLPVGRRKSELLFRYNRVQGVFLGISFPKNISGKYNYLSFHGFVGYGFADKRTRYEAALDHWFFSPKDFRFEIGASLYDKVESKDYWLISPLENTLSSFFLNDDYLDYYQRKGYEIRASQNLTVYFKGMLAYRNDRYTSSTKNTDWALFKDKNRFSDNPPIDEGRMRSWYGELYLDSRDNKELPHSGWYGKFSVESSTKKMKSDFSFNQYIFEVRRYQRLGPWERLDIRIKAASSEGEVPLQKRFHLGGISTLRAYNYRSLRAGGNGGDRMILANFEYNVHPRLFHSPISFGDDFRYIVFFDIGDVWQRKDVTPEDGWDKGFDHLKLNKLKSDLGIGFSNASGRFRINFAKRLDTGKKPFTISFRIRKPF